MASESNVPVSALIERLMAMSLTSFAIARAEPTSNHDSDDPDHESDRPLPERIILINPLTQGMVVIGGTGFDSLVNDLTKYGQPPASRASIEKLSKTEIKSEKEIESLNGECVICLEEWKIGDVVNEMPCKHKFHGGCVEKWLKIHGSCPVCRYTMPVDDDSGKKNGGESESGRRRGEVWVTFAFGNAGFRSGSEGSDEES